MDSTAASQVLQNVRDQFETLPGTTLAGRSIKSCDDFSYTDPIDGSISQNQGVRILFDDSSRIIFRLSGTGTSGATVRLYLESFEADTDKQNLDAQDALSEMIEAADSVSKLRQLSGRDKPTVIT